MSLFREANFEVPRPTDQGFEIHSLTLAGFGVFDSATCFVLPARQSVWIGPNESGKSTFVAGLLATLFGLPETSNAARFGTARHRSFSRPNHFHGELHFSLHGRRYRIHRRFDTHRVRLIEERANGNHQIFEGEHNPQGRSSAGKSFADELKNLVGLSNLELYEETFCVRQPLVEGAGVSQELQHLLSGSRSARVDDILLRLFQQIKEHTRFTGDRSVLRPGTQRPTNQSTDGQLEEVIGHLEQLRAQEQEASGVLAELQSAAGELERLESRLREIDAASALHHARLGSLDRWLELAKERDRRAETVTRFRTAREEWRRLEIERSVLETEIESRHTPFRGTPESLGETLEALERAAAAEDEHRVQRAQIETNRTAALAEAARLEGRLTEEFAAVRGRTDLVELQGRARAARDRALIRSTRLEVLRLETAALEHAPSDGAGPSIETLEVEARAMLSDVNRWRELERRRSEIEAQLEGRAFLAEENRMAALTEKLALEAEIKDARARLREVRSEERAAEERLRRLEAGAGLPIAPPAASSRSPRWARVSIPSAMVLSVLMGVAVFLLAHRNVWAGGAAAVFLFALLFLLNRLLPEPGVKDPRAEPVEAVDVEGGDSPETARRARDAWASELARLAGDEKQAEARLEELRTRLGAFADLSSTEWSALEARWRGLDEERTRIGIEQATLAAERFGTEDNWEVLPAAEAPGGFPALARLRAEVTGDTEPSCIGMLAHWLELLPPSDWESFREAQRARGRTHERRREMEREREQLEAESSIELEAADLLRRLAPFDLETPVESITARMKEAAALEEALRNSRATAGSLPGADVLDARAAQFEARRITAADAVKRDYVGELPSTGLSAWASRLRADERPARDAFRHREEIAERQALVLSQSAESTIEALERKELGESSALGVTIREQEDLEARDLVFQAVAMERDPASRLRLLEAMRDEEQETRRREQEERAEAVRERDRWSQRRAELIGARPQNLARLEIEAAHLAVERTRLSEETDALVLAWQEVRASAQEFQSSHRSELEARLGAYFRQLTGREDRRLTIDEHFELRVEGADGRTIAVEQLSQGTHDQLALALRLSVADLLTGAVPLPLLLDDPFVHFDAERLERMRQSLQRLSRPWILLSHREDLAAWGASIEIRPA